MNSSSNLNFIQEHITMDPPKRKDLDQLIDKTLINRTCSLFSTTEHRSRLAVQYGSNNRQQYI